MQGLEMCRVLDEDPDLADAVPEGRRAAAIHACRAPVLRIDSGAWDPPRTIGADVMGMLILSGTLIRRTSVGSRFAVVLLGAGDLARPWHLPATGQTPAPKWVVTNALRVAMLDAGFVRQLAVFPEIAGALVQRIVETNRDLATNMAIASHTRVDARLHMLLWQLAARWGRMRPDGVLLPLKLTHQLLGDLVAARRPTVTTALSELAERGLVEQRDDGWLLKGDAPATVPAAL